MSLFQRISKLISFIIFALATKQNLVNGITNSSHTDGISNNSYTDMCNKTPQPSDCNTCFFYNPGSGRGDARELAKIMIDICATNQAWPLLQMFDKLKATDPNQSVRAIYGFCSSKYQVLIKSMSIASLDLSQKKEQEARYFMKTALSLHFECYDQLKNLPLPGNMGTSLRNLWAYAVDTESIIDQIPK